MLDKSSVALTSERLLRIRRIEPEKRPRSHSSACARGPARSRPANGKLVFVHGYNVDFENALKRIARFAFDLDFSGTCLLFSWPSKAKLLRYATTATAPTSPSTT